MRFWLGILFLSIIGSLQAQFDLVKENYAFLTWEVAQNAHPDTVYAIDFSKSKLDSLPTELQKFKHLKALDLSKNKLTVLPSYIKEFHKLEFLDLYKNEFTTCPPILNLIPSLKYLSLAKNSLNYLNPGICSLPHLMVLDLYDCMLTTLPEEFAKLNGQLTYVDLRGQTFNEVFVEKWTALLKDVEVKFDPPCNCKN
ncbi:hypothetical protein SAMN05216474_3022 [Lishizhenia tianjinensis]|uniref:Leucine rich repeat-containing protein n=1 Tax=Lishizhenia tianjinensis TaxID=477690 RepID=A0A1I7BRC9_9FLAO|nr:hypothetical protein [Lishizhenia tianjinensis]SFT89748.1 hypothetical protein SAMN05216474_3022 [Lishizhenia tianjinensis]